MLCFWFCLFTFLVFMVLICWCVSNLLFCLWFSCCDFCLFFVSVLLLCCCYVAVLFVILFFWFVVLLCDFGVSVLLLFVDLLCFLFVFAVSEPQQQIMFYICFWFIGVFRFSCFALFCFQFCCCFCEFVVFVNLWCVYVGCCLLFCFLFVVVFLIFLLCFHQAVNTVDTDLSQTWITWRLWF